jgi:hypothetical protein
MTLYCIRITGKDTSNTFVYNGDGKQAARDLLKNQISQEEGITLITIPYWWRQSLEFVRSEVAALRPDLVSQEYARPSSLSGQSVVQAEYNPIVYMDWMGN